MTHNALAMASRSFYYRSVFTVGGMTCGSCVQSIKNSVSSLSTRVFTVSVSLDAGAATVKHGEEISADTICHTISNAGFDCSVSKSERLPMQDSHFDVVGMTCDSCVHSIRAGLRQLDGVLAVSVSLDERSATIQHDVNTLPDEIAEKIRQLGFDAYPSCLHTYEAADRKATGMHTRF